MTKPATDGLPRLYKQGQLVVGDWLVRDVELEDWQQPLPWLLEMYDHESVSHKQAARTVQGDNHASSTR